MEQRNDDLSNEEGLPVPGTDEGDETGADGAAGSGPGNVSVDEPTAAALEGDAGSPGGAEEAEDSDDSDDESSDEDAGEDEGSQA